MDNGSIQLGLDTSFSRVNEVLSMCKSLVLRNIPSTCEKYFREKYRLVFPKRDKRMTSLLSRWFGIKRDRGLERIAILFSVFLFFV